MAGAQRKRPVNANLQSLLHTGGISRKGLQHVLDRLAERPVDRVTAEELRDAELSLFTSVQVSETLRLEDGSNFTWEMCEPALLISAVVQRSQPLQAIYDSAMRASTGGPWHLAVEFDEFTPGSSHRPVNRKSQ